MSIIENDNAEDIIKNWDHPIQPEDSENLYKLLHVVASENRRIDVELNELYDNRFLATASGVNLEKIAELVGIVRKTNETDEKLRKRVRAGFAAKASDTTYETFATIALSITGANPASLTITTPPESGSKTVKIEIDGAVLDDLILTKDELVVLLNNALSADGLAVLTEIGSFGFDGDDASLEGFNEGTWSVGLNS
jgi:phage-related baseplate assembly protein